MRVITVNMMDLINQRSLRLVVGNPPRAQGNSSRICEVHSHLPHRVMTFVLKVEKRSIILSKEVKDVMDIKFLQSFAVPFKVVEQE